MDLFVQRLFQSRDYLVPAALRQLFVSRVREMKDARSGRTGTGAKSTRAVTCSWDYGEDRIDSQRAFCELL